MFKLTVSFLLFSVLFLYSSVSFAQDMDEMHVVHIQKNTMKGMLGDDAKAFNEMLVRQEGVINGDSRVINSYVLRHFWGADSRDLIIVTEFKNEMDLFSFYNDLNSMFEKAFSKEQLDADDAMWNKYVGQHSDEIYSMVPGTSK
jgi:hypothetical protein